MVLLATVCLSASMCNAKPYTPAFRPHLYMYAHSNELDEVGVISLNDSSVKVEHTPEMDALFDVSSYNLTSFNSHLIFRSNNSANSLSHYSPHPTLMLLRHQTSRNYILGS